MVWNDAGKAALDYRIGTYGSFRRSMLLNLADKDSLRQLATRSEDDPTISLISAWAAALDVMTFYQERIANEAYLRTSIERRSVLELALTIGYELNPGVAASTYMAFTVDDAPGAPESVRLDVGTRIQSQPAQDETPQTFETVEPITAYRAWNALKPVTRRLQTPRFGARHVTLRGRNTGLKRGDAILIVGEEREDDAGNERWDFRRVDSITVDDAHDVTTVGWLEGLGAFRGGRFIYPAEENARVYAFKTRANLFGYNAPSLAQMIQVAKATNPNASQLTVKEWDNLNISYQTAIPNDLADIHLDAAYPQIVAKSWIALSKPGASAANRGYVEAYKVVRSVESSVTAFTLSGRTTRLTLLGENLVSEFGNELQRTQVFGESIELPIGEEVLTDPVEGVTLELSALVEGLTIGRFVSITGLLDADGTAFSGAFQIADQRATSQGTTVLEFTVPVPALIRESVVVNANVAPATHGESTSETLGSGNASTANQQFRLKKTPLTYVPSDSTSGQASTLEVRVNDLLWHEVPTLYGASSSDRVYKLIRSDDGSTTVRFGDGISGLRLPTGPDNVKASYRTGIGLAALVRANQIKLLLSRPLGLREATNPAAPTGAADPETLDGARHNAPLHVLTLDRIVSLKDFEFFASAFAGIAKAQAGAVWSGQDRIVHLTVAAEGGAEVSITGDLGGRLVRAIDAARHPDRLVRVDSYEALPFVVEAVVLPDPEFILDGVLAEAGNRLVAAFSFEAMALGQGVALSDVLTVLQGTPGVVAAQVNALYLAGTPRSRQEQLRARRARLESGVIRAAQLLSLSVEAVSVVEMTL